jgi:ATP-dependent DNA helicase RecQ
VEAKELLITVLEAITALKEKQKALSYNFPYRKESSDIENTG